MRFNVPAFVLAVASLSAVPAFSQTDFTYQSYPTPDYTATYQPLQNEHAADFNQDGFADALVVNSQGLYLILNNGSGGFGTALQTPINFIPVAVTIADFNGDGHLDIAALSYKGSVSLVYGHGDGTFSAPTTVQLPPLPAGDILSSIVTADFDGNNTPDLAVLDGEGNLTILYNSGTGQFTQQQVKLDNPASGLTTASLVVGDFNGDGRPDLAWVENGNVGNQGSTIFSALNTAKGVFTPKNMVGTLPIGSGTLVSADLDLDGKSDLVGFVTELTENCCMQYNLPLFYSNGNGTFTTSTLGSAISNDVGVTDVNGDGIPDVVVGSNIGLTVFLGKGNRTFSAQGTYNVPGGLGPIGLGWYQDNNRVGLTSTNINPTNPNMYSYLYQLFNDNPQGDCQYPTVAGVSFCSAVQNGNQVQVRGTARALAQPVQHIELWANGQKLYQVFSDEFNATLNLPAGTPITAVEVEANGSTQKATTVAQPGTTCAVPTSPGVRVCSPTAGQATSSPVSVIAFGAGASGTVNHLELWIDGSKIGNYAGASMNTSVPLSSGLHTATVIEVDSKGAYIKSTPVTFTVGASACAAPTSPGVHICSPTPGQTTSSPVNVVASGAGASGTVNHLELWVNGSKIGNYKGATMNVNVALPAGSDAATVVEVDSKGAYIKSSPVMFTVR